MIVLVSTIVLTGIIQIMNLYAGISPFLFVTVIIILKVFKGLMIAYLVAATIYIFIKAVDYLNSTFYHEYHIGFFDAFLKGHIAMYPAYRFIMNKDVKNVTVDLKNNIITFRSKYKNYSVICIDLFGLIDGKEDAEVWIKKGKGKKEFGRVTYPKKTKFKNPFRTNQEYIRKLQESKTDEFVAYVCLTGLHKLNFESRWILTPYELFNLE